MSDHLDLDTLADVLAGVAAPEHLDDCASCRARLAELAAALPAVSASLAALPEPPEPPDLAARITAALSAVRAEQPALTGGDVVPLAGRRTRSPRVWKVAAGAAAAAVVVTGAVLVAQRNGTSSHQASRTGWTVSSTGTDYAAGPSALSAQLPALLAGTASRAPIGAGPGTAEKSLHPSGDTIFSPGTPAAVDALAGLRTTSGLAQCLSALSDPGQPGLPLALDYARYKGVPALVVVLPSSKAGKVDVFIVGAGCAPADAKLLFFARLAKP